MEVSTFMVNILTKQSHNDYTNIDYRGHHGREVISSQPIHRNDCKVSLNKITYLLNEPKNSYLILKYFLCAHAVSYIVFIYCSPLVWGVAELHCCWRKWQTRGGPQLHSIHSSSAGCTTHGHPWAVWGTVRREGDGGKNTDSLQLPQEVTWPILPLPQEVTWHLLSLHRRSHDCYTYLISTALCSVGFTD